MADLEDEEKTIQGEAKQCWSLFTDIMAQLSQQDPLSIGINLQDELGRFNLWAGNISVFAPLQASLDFRLIDVPDIKAQFLRQLDTLGITLTQLDEAVAQATAEGNEAPRDPDEDATWPADGSLLSDHDIVDLVQSIHVTIDWLHRLSNLVRKASFGSQNQRAARFPLVDETGNDITECLAEIFRHLIKRECCDISDQILNRLSQTMIIRRRRVLYRRSRQKRWALQQEPYRPRHLDPPPHLPPLQESAELGEDRESSEFTEEITFEPKSHVQVAPSRLTVTTLDEQKYKKLAAPSRISRATTAPFQHNEKLLVPPRPHLARDGKEFVCDYCCLILPSSEAADQDTWANHVKKDLDPYICVFDDCDQPYQIFSSSKEWLAHMRSEHRMSWRCVVRDHPPQTFETRGAFLNHMELNHPGKFRKEQLPFIAESSCRALSPTLPACAFCAEESGDLENHVAQHLHHFALQSLPWPEHLDQGSEITNGWEMNSSTSEDVERETLKDDLSDTLSFIDVDWLHDLNSGPEPLLGTPVSWPNVERTFEEPDQVLSKFAANAARRVTTAPSDRHEEPETLDEELRQVREQLPGVEWTDADMDTRLLRVSLRGPWGFEGEHVVLNVKVAVPHDYPETQAPSFLIEQDEHMPEVVREMLQREIREICQLGLQQKETCLAKAFSYLLGEQEPTSSIGMFNVERGNAVPLGDVDEDKPPSFPLSQPDLPKDSNVADNDKAAEPDKTKVRPKSGYLAKRGKTFGSWKYRFYVVEGPQLKYYDAAGGAELGSIQLQGAQIGREQPRDATSSGSNTSFKHSLLILEPKNNSRIRHVLCADSDEERDLWVETLLPWTNSADSDEEEKSEHERPRVADSQTGAPQPSDSLIQNYGELIEQDPPWYYVHVASASIGKTRIDCRLNVSKTEFGTLGSKSLPAGIIYMDITIAGPQNDLQSITITVTLDDEDPDLLKATQEDRSGNLENSNSAVGLGLTDYYGPKNMAIGGDVDTKTQRPQSKMPGIGTIGISPESFGTEHQPTTTTENLAWHISGHLISGNVRWLYRTLRWELSELSTLSYGSTNTDAPSTRQTDIQTGFAFEGRGRPFFLVVEIGGKVSKIRDRLRQKTIQFTRVNQNSAQRGKTLIHWARGLSYPLDVAVRALPTKIEMANLSQTPLVTRDARSVHSVGMSSGDGKNEDMNTQEPIEDMAREESARLLSFSDYPSRQEQVSSLPLHHERHEQVDTQDMNSESHIPQGSDTSRPRVEPQEGINVEKPKYVVMASNTELHSPMPKPKRVGFVGQSPEPTVSYKDSEPQIHGHADTFSKEIETRKEGPERWDSNNSLHEGLYEQFDIADEVNGLPFQKVEFNKIEETKTVMGSNTAENRMPSFSGTPSDEETGEAPWMPGPSNVEMGAHHPTRLDDILEEPEEDSR